MVDADLRGGANDVVEIVMALTPHGLHEPLPTLFRESLGRAVVPGARIDTDGASP